MPDLADGESIEMQGSGKEPYLLKNTGGVYSCTCPAWRNQSVAIEKRTCKHLRKLRGDAAETERIGNAVPPRKPESEGDEAAGPPLLLAHSWENETDLAGWWMSEKLDGVRAYWDGKQFLSRQGNLFLAPDWFTKGFPKTALDGELWIDRKAFQKTVSIVRRQDRSEHWKDVRYVIFDAPAVAEPFETRVELIQDTVKRVGLKHVLAHAHELCRGLDHLREELQRVEALGGEGLMLRQPGSKYEAGRSTTLLKVKTFHENDATVVEHLAGKGRHQGRLGALLVRLADGTEFSVGTGFSDRERLTPPPVGSTITFRFQELSDAGVPRFPSFARARTDLPTAEAPARRSLATSKAPAAPPDPPKPAASVSAAKRYFEFVEGNSSKFWEIAQSGNDVTVRYGKIGANGQTKTHTLADEPKAKAFAEKLIAEKTDKGYVETM